MKRALILFLFPLFTIGVRGAGLKTVSVLEGDSVTLHTDVPEIKRYDVIRWRFGQKDSPVAEINRTAAVFSTYDGPDGRFRDRLQLDHHTGSLTIKKAETNHSGRYEVEISSSKHTIHKSFNVTVDEMKTVLVTEGDSVPLHTGTDKMDEERMFGDIANISKGRFSAYGGPDGKFKDILNDVTDKPMTRDSVLSTGWIIGICAVIFIIVAVLSAVSIIRGWFRLLLCW